MSMAKKPQVSLTGTIQKLNIQVICFKPTIQLSHLNSTIYATPKCSYIYLSLTQNVFVNFQKEKKKPLNYIFPQFTTVCNTLCVWANTCPWKKKKWTSTSL